LEKVGTGAERLSPLHHKHLELGAKMRVYDGWMQAENYEKTAEAEAKQALLHVGICDISPVPKLDIKGRDIDAFLESALASKDFPRLPSEVSVSPGGEDSRAYACRLTKEHAIMIGGPPQLGQLSSPLDASSITATNGCHLTNVTSVYAGLNIVGPSSTALLTELMEVDVFSNKERVRWCLEGGLAKVRAMVVHAGGDSFDIFFGRDYAEYVWDELVRRGMKYSMVPFGFEAHRLIREAKGANS
jgi:sarcosine oxidase, subunit alpha